ncbi:MAG: recombinase family protein [Octadecabacter sp.]|nr:recombinase family protein [Octadecabacter sp.]
MSRTFAYARVSTTEQATENQVGEIEAAGFMVEPHRIISETISGSVSAMQRPGFTRLLDKMEQGDVLIVTKLDRLGRDAIDVTSTVNLLDERDIRVHCLALGGTDLTSSSGRLTMQVINAVAQFERDLLIERTQAGLARAKAEGKRIGRPPALSSDDQEFVRVALAVGKPVAAIAREFGVSRQTIMRVRDCNSLMT